MWFETIDVKSKYLQLEIASAAYKCVLVDRNLRELFWRTFVYGQYCPAVMAV